MTGAGIPANSTMEFASRQCQKWPSVRLSIIKQPVENDSKFFSINHSTLPMFVATPFIAGRTASG